MSVDVHETCGANPIPRQFLSAQIEPVITLPEDSALAGLLIDDDERKLARAINHLDQMCVYSFARELFTLQTACGIVSDFPDIAAAQSPTVAGNSSRGRLPSRKRTGGENLCFRVEGGETRHADERVGGVEADSDDIGVSSRQARSGAVARNAGARGGSHRTGSTATSFVSRHEPKTLCNRSRFASGAHRTGSERADPRRCPKCG